MLMDDRFDCPKRVTRTTLQQKQEIQIEIKPTPGMKEGVGPLCKRTLLVSVRAAARILYHR